MRPQDVRLPAPMADELRNRADALLALGTLGADAGPGAAEAIAELAERLQNTYPYPDPMYAGQMLKPPAPVAWAAYATAMLLNPNNHALDGGPATAELEREAVEQLRVMLGVPAPGLGHLTSSGTVANLEALWVARELTGGATVLSSAGAHYTHARMCGVLGVEHEAVATGRPRAHGPGRPGRPAGAAAAWAPWWPPWAPPPWARWTTRMPSPTCAPSTARGCTWTRPTAASSRCWPTAAEPGVARGPYAAIARADSVVIDPHKHGLQPYGCGCVLFADPDVGRLYAHDSPYTYFTSPDLHLGEISLECSRAGASAAALWTTLRALPLTRAGLGAGLADCRAAALALADAPATPTTAWSCVVEPELDIVCVRAPGADAERAFADTGAGGLARGHAAHRSGHGAALLPAQARAPGRGRRAGRRARRAPWAAQSS